jgi:hypothetical protein
LTIGLLSLAGALVDAERALQAADATPATAARNASSPAEVAIQKALLKKVNAEFIDTPFRDAIAYLAEVTGTQILIDRRGLTDAGINPDDPVSLKVKDVSMKSAIGLLLEQLNAPATYAIRHEVLQITSQDKANSRLTTKVYALGELGEGDADLTAVIMAHIAPDSWDAVGGQASVHVLNGALIVTQTEANQDAIANLLADLREVGENRAKTPSK